MASSSRISSSGTVLLTVVALHILLVADFGLAATPYFGKKIGSFKTYHHGVVGDVYAVDSRTIHVKGFSYDGQGPDAFFWAGSSTKPNSEGFIVPDEKGTKSVLKAYRNRDLTLTLPEGKTLKDIKWLSVWCRSFAANFADIVISSDFDAPRPKRLEGIVGVMHNTSSGPIVIVDAQTFMVPNFHTDGQAPDAHFWAGHGPKPTADGILVPDENGSTKPLGRYDGQSLVITLPGDLTVFDIDWLSVWCIEFAVDFGHVKIPKNLNVPPSLKMLGVSPQSKLNCEVLSDDLGFEVRWARAGDTVVVQLVARLSDGEYMSFGLSGDPQHSQMIDGDVIVAWIDAVGNGHAIDYFLADKAQCAGGRGSCPDRRIQPNTNTVRLLNAAVINGYSMITYQRPLVAVDRWDLPMRRNGSQPIIWAVGPLNSEDEASYHSQRNKADMFIDFGRSPSWNCPAPLSDPQSQAGSKPEVASSSTTSKVSPSPSASASAASTPSLTRQPADRTQSSGVKDVSHDQGDQAKRPMNSNTNTTMPSNRPPAASATPLPVKPAEDAWYIPPIECPEPQDNVFYAQIGPAGGKKGYSSITSHVGWGIAWYINGLLIPEVTVVRGKTYTFVVEGGNDPETPARNHPFYITDDPVGGLGTKSLAEQEKVRVYAGVRFNADGEPEASAAGRLCEWVQRSKEAAEEYSSFGEYQRVLELSCDKGQAAVLQWTPDSDTPDLVYYQCYTHRYLGWKIHVVDQCELDHDFGSSFVHETNVSRGVQKQQHVEAANAGDVTEENSGRSFPDSKLIRVGGGVSSVVSTKIGVGNMDPSESEAVVAAAAYHRMPNGANVRLIVQDDGNATFVKDPFVSNESVPFQAGFRPGEPQFGGFGASDFGQRFEKAPPIYVSKQIVPVVAPKLPSRLGSVYQPNAEPHRRQTSKVGDVIDQIGVRQPIVFRTAAAAVADQAPAGIYVRRRVRPLSDPIKVAAPTTSNIRNRPPQHHGSQEAAINRRQFIVQSGGADAVVPVALPAKKLQVMTAVDDPILTNVWSIINKEKEVQHVRNSREKRDTMLKMNEPETSEAAAAAAEPEPTSEPEPIAANEGMDHSAGHGGLHDVIESAESQGIDTQSEADTMTTASTTTTVKAAPTGSGSTSPFGAAAAHNVILSAIVIARLLLT